MEVTVSGMVRARRQEIKEQVERLRGCYAGGLTVGQTAAVVVDGMPDWLQPKLAAAAANDIPVVSVDWLEDSALHGFLLCPSNYRLLPGQSRRSSVASTNAGVSAAPAAPASLLPASLQLQPAAVQALLEPALGLLHSSGQGSPEVERLRGEQRPPEGSPMAAAFVCAENADDRTPHATGSTGPLAQDVLQRLQAAPDALRVQLPSPCSPVMSPGPGLLRLPTPLQPPSGGPLLAPAAADAETQNEGATPQPSDAPGGTASPAQQQAETDSDTMIARFLSRMPQVTVARGSCRPRGLSPDSSVGSSSCGRASLGCLLGSRDGHGAAERRDSCRLSGANSAAATLQGRPVAPQAVRQGHLEEAAPDQDPSYPAQASSKLQTTVACSSLPLGDERLGYGRRGCGGGIRQRADRAGRCACCGHLGLSGTPPIVPAWLLPGCLQGVPLSALPRTPRWKAACRQPPSSASAHQAGGLPLPAPWTASQRCTAMACVGMVTRWLRQ